MAEQYIIHKSQDRGTNTLNWLDTRYSFSFADWQHPERMNFGALRVLNDDKIAPGMGFSMHPHRDMEIVTIPLKGELRHDDVLGNTGILRPGEVQRMSAGTGIIHSEYNNSKTDPLELLQIWIQTAQTGIPPSYEDKAVGMTAIKNEIRLLVSPDGARGSLRIFQNAYISEAKADPGVWLEYVRHSPNNGIYLFIIDGEVNANKNQLSRRDALGAIEVNQLYIGANSPAHYLIIEVPMR